MSGISDPNPYVGPRSIQRGEPLYGRSREVDELFDRLQARRIVVLHSPSGAGKTSLVQAGLIPRLEEGRYDVWKPIRVNLDPHELDGVPEGTNRYVLSAMLSLEAELPEAHRREPAQLAKLGLREYLESRPRRKRRADRPVVLIFDQFEEVLTVAPIAVEAKRAFFDAVGEALDTGDYWALFSIRDDYIAGLAPYRDRIPTGMANTFRLDLLGLEGAREAAEQPALAGGREFPAVDKLIEDLSTIQVQQHDGSFVAEQGLYVEPVQLQVVCRRLWEAMPEDDRVIDEEDISRYASVSESLAAYYCEAVDRAAQGDVANERRIRDWIGTKLIVGGIRAQVRQEAERSGGLDNDLISHLRASYLVRSEHRAGANWFELSHDRLVEPVREDNERWEQQHLHPLQIQARIWEATSPRSAAMLLRGPTLFDALKWAAENDALLTDAEREFLHLSQLARKRRQRISKAVIAAIVVLVLGLVAMGVLLRAAIRAKFSAMTAQIAAEEAEKEALKARDLATDATRIAGVRELMAHESGQPAAAALLLAQVQHPEHARGWTQLAIELLAQPMSSATLDHEDAVNYVAWSRDGSRILTASADGAARLWRADGSDQDTPVLLAEHGAPVFHASFSPDGSRILTLAQDKVARVWSFTGDRVEGAPIYLGHEDTLAGAAWSPDSARLVTTTHDGTIHVWAADGSDRDAPLRMTGHEDVIHDVAWSPDRARILTVSEDTTARVWKADGSDSGRPVVFRGHTGPIVRGVWSPDSTRVVTASRDRSARVWSVVEAQAAPLVFDNREAPVLDVAWSPDGEHILTASRDRVARVWRVDGSNLDEPTFLVGHKDVLVRVQWSSDGKRILTTSRDKTARIWQFTGVRQIGGMVLAGHEDAVESAAWSPDDSLVVTASSDGTARIWSSTGSTRGSPIRFAGHEDAVTHAAWSPDGSQIVTSSLDATARVWAFDRTRRPFVLSGHERRVVQAAWSPDGERIATVSLDQTARIWRADGSGTPVVLSGHEGPLGLVAWSSDGERIVTTSRDGTARIWPASGGDPVTLGGHEGLVVHAAWDPAGARVVTVSADAVRVWQADRANVDAPLVLVRHEGGLNHAEWSPDGARIVTTSIDDTAQVWRADGSSAGEPIVLAGHEGLVNRAAWSPDGARIATASLDRTARVWSVDASELGDPRILADHEGSVIDVVWSPDGARVATLSQDRSVRIWRVEGEGEHEPLVLAGHEGPVSSAAWSPDGAHLLTTTLASAEARVWVLEPEALQAALREVTRDCLAPEQRQDYFAETRAEALAAYASCEADHGRHRFPGELNVNLIEVTIPGASEDVSDAIREALQQRTSMLRRCYRASLSLDAPRRSRLAIDLVIDAAGKFHDAKVNAAKTDLDASAGACVAEIIEQQRIVSRALPTGAQEDESEVRLDVGVIYNLSWK